MSKSSSDAWERREQIIQRFESALLAGTRPVIEDFLPADPVDRPELLPELIHAELECRRNAGEPVHVEEYLQRFGEYEALLRERLPCQAEGARTTDHLAPRSQMSDLKTNSSPLPAVTTGRRAAAVAPGTPNSIGRYRIERLLGEGGCGRVYLAHDDQLHRAVAVKVPHRERVTQAADLEAYLAEARILAELDHPHIVPVYDLGQSEDGLCFVVSKFIQGSDLKSRLQESSFSPREAAELAAVVAEALHHAHHKGLVHRDIKPANILLDTAGKPYVADFGLALREEDFGRGTGLAGTPAYMSPEQARGEGHRVDGRSDIFSLGIVLYEMLARRRPFPGETRSVLLEQIATVEVRPPRQMDDSIPRELERICLKALAKRASERYTTAKDLAEDLRHFLAQAPATEASAGHSGIASTGVPVVGSAATSTPTAIPQPLAPSSERQALKIVPKGLRSFDSHDADFFLELLPGPRDRWGLPEKLRFWKTRIEEQDPDTTFAVGLIYGPSGCGKSSLVKAGLLPRLAGAVQPVYVEAAAATTEERLLKQLRKRCPDLPPNMGLAECLAALRKGRGLAPRQKVLLVLDQFEQWLHARKEEAHAELVAALRQCDGGRVQCLLLVRDDFWMAVTRFLSELEIELVQGENCAAADLFDPDHARRVLAGFGRAFGKLPESPAETTPEQKEFLKQAVSGLSQDGKIICVRLALFAEMMKGKPWTPAGLKEVGGAQGVGVTFLEETFSAPSANPKHRLHEQAARAVLQALLPAVGTDLKGRVRSATQLREISGYENRPRDFEELIRILDTEIRLITPADTEGVEQTNAGRPPPGGKYYQLTHDYLVPALRDWLTRKQKETRRGRAQLLLADRAGVWIARPENRQLPSIFQWTAIRFLTRKKGWTQPQAKMMRRAARYHALRGLVLIALLAAITATGLSIRGHLVGQERTSRAIGLVRQLLDAEVAKVPDIITGMKDYRAWTDPLLREEFAEAVRAAETTKGEAERARYAGTQLRASLGLLPADASQVGYLYRRLLDAEPQEVAVIRDALGEHKGDLTKRLWAEMQQPANGEEPRILRAASALAAYDPQNPRWDKASSSVVRHLVAVNPAFLGSWLECLRPVKARLLAPLATVYRDRGEDRAAERTLATSILADYAAGEPEMLAHLLLDADPQQFAVLFPKTNVQNERVVPVFQNTVQTPLASKDSEREKELLAKRQANAAVALLRLGHGERVWPLLEHSADPRTRSYLIHRLGPCGAELRAIAQRLAVETEISIRRALLLSLGECGPEQFPPSERALLLARAIRLYQEDSDPGVHGAAEWLLCQWKQEQSLKGLNERWRKDAAGREKKLQSIHRALAAAKTQTAPHWYVNQEGQTLVVLSGTVEFQMGSPPTEADRNSNEQRHTQRIERTFAIAAQPVTVAQFLRFRQARDYNQKYAPRDDCPIHGPSWYMAAAYCNWLSEQERIAPDQWCFEPNARGQYGPGMKLRANALNLTGYRLPTEAEWEYACRAATMTSRHYGESLDLLGKYAVFQGNSGERSLTVWSRKPNDFGFFDMHGNVWNWCQTTYKSYARNGNGDGAVDDEDARTITNQVILVMRGGSFLSRPGWIRSARRIPMAPGNRNEDGGFRVARTFANE